MKNKISREEYVAKVLCDQVKDPAKVELLVYMTVLSKEKQILKELTKIQAMRKEAADDMYSAIDRGYKKFLKGKQK